MLLEVFTPCFTAPSFRTFCALAAGFLAQPGRRTVCGMLTGAGLSRVWAHHRAHLFFSHARWSAEDLGLALARLVVALLVPAGAAVLIAVDDTLFKRTGKKVQAIGYAARWSIEVAIEDAKQVFGAGQARNRLAAAVHRTLPFTLACQSLAVLWYANAGHHPADVDGHRARAPWYRTKAEPWTADMIAKLRRVLIAAKYRPVHPASRPRKNSTSATAPGP